MFSRPQQQGLPEPQGLPEVVAQPDVLLQEVHDRVVYLASNPSTLVDGVSHAV